MEEFKKQIIKFQKANNWKEILKIVLVGECFSGKSSVVNYFANNFFTEDYVPTVFEQCLTKLTMGRTTYQISLWDTLCAEVSCDIGENLEILRKISQKWYKEIKDNVDTKKIPPIFLVVTKCDKRNDIAMSKRDEVFLKRSDMYRIAEKIGAVGYFEVSAKTGKNIRKLFEECVRTIIFRQNRNSKSEFKRLQHLEIEKKKLKKKLKLVIKENVRVAKQEFKKYYRFLCRDIVVLILNEFLLMNFKNIYEFNEDFNENEFDKYNLSYNSVFFKFFGVFKGDSSRKIYQLFYNFKIGSVVQRIFIPKMRKTLIQKKGENDIIMKFQNFYGPEVEILSLQNIDFGDYGRIIKRRVIVKNIQRISFRQSVMIKKKDSELLLCHLSRNGNKLNKISIFFSKVLSKIAPFTFSGFPELRELNLRCIIPRRFNFKNLRKLYFHSDWGFTLSETQFKDITKLQYLEDLYLRSVNLSNVEKYIPVFFEKRPLKFIVLFHCIFNYFYLKQFFFPPEGKLEFLGIVNSPLRNLNQSNLPNVQNHFPHEFLDFIEKQKKFKYYVKSVNISEKKNFKI